jgi:hypothetical protein
VLITVSLAWIGTAAAADSLDGDRFSLSLGVFITDRNTDAELDGSNDDGTKINFERDLGIDSSDTVFRVDGYYRFSEHHRFDFSVFDLSRSASKQIVKDIQWGDMLYAIDNVDATDSTFNGALDWRYSGALVFLKFNF